VYVVIAYVLAHLFLAYFVSAAQLLRMIKEGPRAHLSTFLWGMGMTVALYWNFFWFREQLCLIVCPYGRLQSVMQDPDTVVIGYDKRRGEPRGKVHQQGAGDCVDCHRCVAVCPTSIDIRNGLQMECIGCAGCIDACDEIMVKLGRPKGLIRYDSERALTSGDRRFLRPRLYLYTALGALGLIVSTTLFLRHTAFESNFLHARGASYVLDGALVRNQLILHLINKNPSPTVLTIQSRAAEPLTLIIPQPEIALDSLASIEVPVIASLPRAAYRPGMRIRVQVSDQASKTERLLDVALVGPNTPQRAEPKP
jgi:cytochrome c oxidase accessory protein FixG